MRRVNWAHLAKVANSFEAMDIAAPIWDLVALKDAWLRAHATNEMQWLESVTAFRVRIDAITETQADNIAEFLEVLSAVADSPYAERLTNTMHILLHAFDIPGWARTLLHNVINEKDATDEQL
jgi:hypothetical protein